MTAGATVEGVSQRAAELHESAIVIDGLTYYYDGPTPKLNARGLTAMNVTACEVAHDFTPALREIIDVRSTAERDPGCTVIRTANDIERAKRDGQVGVVIGVQASYLIGTDLWRLQVLHDAGLRIFQLTYNNRGFTGDGCLEPVDGGLTRFGRQVIEELARLGIALDLSHAGRRTSLEAIAAAPAPPMFSHANPQALTKSPRNLTDEQIRAIGERDGLIGVCTWGPLCWKNRPGSPPTDDDFVDHIDYVVQMIGIDRVGIATDSGCTTNQAWLDAHSAEVNAIMAELTGDYLRDVGGGTTHPKTVADLTNLVRVTDTLLRRGYSDDDIRKIMGGNFLRHLRTVWGGN